MVREPSVVRNSIRPVIACSHTCVWVYDYSKSVEEHNFPADQVGLCTSVLDFNESRSREWVP